MRMKFETKREYKIHYLIGVFMYLVLGVIAAILTSEIEFILYSIGIYIVFCIIDYIEYKYFE